MIFDEKMHGDENPPEQTYLGLVGVRMRDRQGCKAWLRVDIYVSLPRYLNTFLSPYIPLSPTVFPWKFPREITGIPLVRRTRLM